LLERRWDINSVSHILVDEYPDRRGGALVEPGLKAWPEVVKHPPTHPQWPSGDRI